MSSNIGVERPVPIASELTEEFWKSISEGRIAIQRCADCGRWIHHPQFRCPQCFGGNLAFETVSGTGRIYTYTVVHRAPDEYFKEHVPYVFAVISLDGTDVRLLSNVVHVALDDIEIDMPVEPLFERVNNDVGIFQFKPVGHSADGTLA